MSGWTEVFTFDEKKQRELLYGFKIMQQRMESTFPCTQPYVSSFGSISQHEWDKWRAHNGSV